MPSILNSAPTIFKPLLIQLLSFELSIKIAGLAAGEILSLRAFSPRARLARHSAFIYFAFMFRQFLAPHTYTRVRSFARAQKRAMRLNV